jgi:hypothetical protein
VLLVAIDLILLFALFISANLSLAWGEAGSFPVTGDKSSLAGFGGIVILMPMRWLALALALWVGAVRGGFPFLPGAPRWQAAQVILLYVILGVVSYRAFEWIVRGIQRSDPGPQRTAWIFGLVIPTIVFLIAAWAVNRRWVPRHVVIAGLAAAGIVAAHIAGWRSGYRR